MKIANISSYIYTIQYIDKDIYIFLIVLKIFNNTNVLLWGSLQGTNYFQNSNRGLRDKYLEMPITTAGHYWGHYGDFVGVVVSEDSTDDRRM